MIILMSTVDNHFNFLLNNLLLISCNGTKNVVGHNGKIVTTTIVTKDGAGEN